ncbi:hypothetical protein ES705_31413 [subsurface metagenome]
MAEFIHSVLAQDVDPTVQRVWTWDLPVNPLSHIMLTLKTTHTQATLADMATFATEMALIPKIEVLYKGSAIFSMSGYDAWACGLLVLGFESWGLNELGTTIEERSWTILIPMGRKLYDPRECFPRNLRGELVLQVTFQDLPVEYPTEHVQIETVELPDANPSQYLRMTTLTATVTAGGEHDIELPIGWPISECVLWGETKPVGVADLCTIAYVQLLRDNLRTYYSHMNFETMHNMAGRMRYAPGYHGEHTHNGAAALALTGSSIQANHVLAHYVHVPFDIFHDGEYALQTAGFSDVILRIGVDTAVVDLAVRCIPCEIVGV